MVETKPENNPERKSEGGTEEKKKAEATKFVIFLPIVHKPVEKSVSIKAMTDEGKIDTSRDDEFEFSINPESQLRFKDKMKTLKLKLVNGEAQVVIKSGPLPLRAEVVIFRTKWITGKTPLQNAKVTFLVGSHV